MVRRASQQPLEERLLGHLFINRRASVAALARYFRVSQRDIVDVAEGTYHIEMDVGVGTASGHARLPMRDWELYLADRA